MDLYEKTIKSDEKFNGRILKVSVDTVLLPNGSTSTRELVKHAGACAILPIYEKNIVLVKQFRKAIEDVLIEIPAGKLEIGEDPKECAIRELSEETGYKAKKMTKMTNLLTAPGFSNEVLYTFLAEDLEKGEIHLDQDEFVEVFEISPKKAKEKILSGEINDAKTVCSILWYCSLIGV